jgi:alpha-mannosidase
LVITATALFPETPGNIAKRLQALDKLVNRELKWGLSSSEKEPQRDYRQGRRITLREFVLQTEVNGTDNFCATDVLKSPMVLKLKLYCKGLAEVGVWVDKTRVDTFEVDGSSGTGQELERDVIITPSTEIRPYEVVLKVQNKGFKPSRDTYWPPRNKEPKEENSYFSVQESTLLFTSAAENYKGMQEWLLSMKIGSAFLYPDFRRFTFTGKPFEIEDRRRTAKIRQRRLKNILERAVMKIEPALLKTNDPAKLRELIRESYRASRPLRRFARTFKVHLIGNAHIDIAWLWRMAETVEVAKNTFDTVLKNMEEYPELHYAQSQAVTYQWMEKKYPEIFKRIKEKVKEGKWEIVGGMWVEPDCNLISGESWVRQLLYGKRYFKEKFDLDIDTGWNPDSFGYNWNMPQIYTKSGIKRFITQKIWWNDTTVFPHYIFRWQGVDGTQLMTYFPPVGYTARVRMPEDMVKIIRYEATTGYKKSLLLYGLGDHGGGPNREILDRVREYQKLHITPQFIHSKAADFLPQMEIDLAADIPVWKDELYLEYHRGTYTTQGKIKKNNRQCEALLSSAEKIASAVSLTAADNSYPQEELEAAWKIVLINQFHDILPGSSITPVYRDALEDYRRARNKMNRIIDRSMVSLAAQINTSDMTGTPLLVFNPLSWTRTGIVEVNIPLENGQTVKLLDASGKEVPVEIKRSDEPGEAVLYFIARKVPAVGYTVFSMHTQNAAAASSSTDKENSTDVRRFIDVESPFHKLRINKKRGNITSLVDKRLDKEFVEEGKEANTLHIYEDLPENWDAWNIGYTGRMWKLNRTGSVELIEDSAVRKVVKIEKYFLGLSKSRYSPTEEFPSSFFTQYIILYNDLDRIDIKTEADWWEDHMLLKAVFPVSIKSDAASYEIPFAHIKRTTKFETLWEKARFEVPALRWADLSEKDWGISILNDSKYGHDIHGSEIKLSLLRAPTWPDPMADRGKHTFTYSIYTHKGAVSEGNTVQRARELNTPFQAAIIEKQQGTMAKSFSFFDVKSPSVILDSVKRAEDGSGFILRFFESAGKESSAEVVCFKAPKTVFETDLMENPLEAVKVVDKSISLKFKAFEIKTLKLDF